MLKYCSIFWGIIRKYTLVSIREIGNTFALIPSNKRRIRGEYVVKRSIPFYISHSRVRILDREELKHFSTIHLYEINQVDVQGLLIWKGPFLVSKLCSQGPVAFGYQKRQAKYESISNGEFLWISDKWSRGYFHWITEALPRLILAREYRPDLKVLMHHGLLGSNFVSRSLEINGVGIQPYGDGRIKIGKILSPEFSSKTGNYNPELLVKVRDFLLIDPIHVGNSGRKIYISREKASKRKICNETEVQEFLLNEGFEIVFFEDMTFDEQISLMRSTKCLIGLHGAGLTNMLFMSKNSIVAEIRNEMARTDNCYYSMADALELNYCLLLAQSEITDRAPHNADVTVDIADLKAWWSRASKELE